MSRIFAVVLLLFSTLFLHSTLAINSATGAEAKAKVFEYEHADLSSLTQPGIQLLDQATHSVKRRDIVDPTAPTSGSPVEIHDNHDYYHRIVAIDHALSIYYSSEFDRVFATYPAGTNARLNHGKNLALSIPLTFSFDFYGHPVRTVVVTTGGFLYVNEISHPYLAFSQYIAPLMADFETNNAVSSIKYIELGDSFWVRWENMLLSSNTSVGNFTFQCVFFANGSIVFDYISIPISMAELQAASSMLKIGLSDAFYYEVKGPGVGTIMRKIVKYHDLTVPLDHVVTNGVIMLNHLPTCNQQSSCQDCTSQNRTPSFNCSWCYELGRCSSGVDRQLQDWHDSDCHYLKASKCWLDPVATTGGAVISTSTTTANVIHLGPFVTPGTHEGDNEGLICNGYNCNRSSSGDRSGASRVVLGVCLGLLVLAALGAVAGALAYGYRHPGSRLGACLIEHRPSRLRERLSSVRFFSGGGGGGGGGGSGGDTSDRYRVENPYVNFGDDVSKA